MSIGIVGAGAVGSAIATVLARAGIAAKIVNRRGPAVLGPLAASLMPQVTVGTREEVLAADIVFVAVPWGRLDEALAGGDWQGRIVVDCVPGARLVKAFNHMLPHLVAGDPRAEGGRRVLFMAGDDAAAKAEIGALIDRIGFYRIDLGGLREGGRMIEFPGGPLPALNLVVFD